MLKNSESNYLNTFTPEENMTRYVWAHTSILIKMLLPLGLRLIQEIQTNLRKQSY